MLRVKAQPKVAKKTQQKPKVAKKHQQQQKKKAHPSRRGFSTLKTTGDIDRLKQASRYPLTKQSQLPGGLRIATEQQDGQLATVGVFIDAGTRYETLENNGTAHFLEHTLFKGTNRRSRVQLEMEIENMGGSLNAFTSREQTVFTATVQKKNVAQAIDILGDIITQSRITEQAIENERGVILEEANSVAQDIQETVFDRLHLKAFDGSTLGFTILGPEENIKTITKQNIDTYVKTHYTSDRMAICVVGDVDHDMISAEVAKAFRSVPPVAPNGLVPNKGTAKFLRADVRVPDEEMDQTNIAIAWETAGWNDADHYPLMVFQMMLGNYNAERAAAETEGQEYAGAGLSDGISPFNTIYSDTGIFGLYATVDHDTVQESVDSMVYSMIRPMFNVSNAHLDEAKNKLQLSLLAQYEGTETCCQELGRQLLTHSRRIHPVEVLKRIDAIKQGDIQRVARRFFYDKDFAISAVGAMDAMPSYEDLRAKNIVTKF